VPAGKVWSDVLNSGGGREARFAERRDGYDDPSRQDAGTNCAGAAETILVAPVISEGKMWMT
jgi:hypothetical protein